MTDKSGPVTAHQITSLGKLREQVGIERYREIVLMMFDDPKQVKTKFQARRLLAELDAEIQRMVKKRDDPPPDENVRAAEAALFRLRRGINLHRFGPKKPAS